MYFIMKPLEWIFLCVLYLTDAHPENRIAVQYTGKTAAQVENSKILMEKLSLLDIIIFEREAFYMIKVTLTNEILRYITEIEQNRYKVSSVKLSKTVMNKLRKNSKKKVRMPRTR